MRKRIVLVEPAGVGENVFSGHMAYPLLGPLYLAGRLRDAGHSVRVLNENLLGRPVSMADLEADVCCLTVLTPTADRAYDIARQYKALRPGGRVLIGGVHPSCVPDEAVAFADHVVTGEGEDVILDLVDHGAGQRVVAGTRIADLDTVPIPDLGLLQRSERIPRAPMMTSRGCPFQCEFCCVTRMFGHRYRMHSVDRVLEELRRVRRASVFFYDDNFAASPSRTRQILDRMLSAGLRLEWTAQVRADVARDPDLVALMARAGCTRVYVGFESLDDAVLAGMQKHQTAAQVAQAIDVFHRNGIAVHAMFILGSDGESPDQGRATVAFCRRHRVDSVQFAILTPLPGTPLYRRLEAEGRLLHHQWAYFDGLHAVFRPGTGTAAELQDRMLEAFADFYSLSGALNDGLNLLAEAVFRLPRVVATRLGPRAIQAVVDKLGARILIRKWLASNRDYLAWIGARSR